jgi:hypothetical protein
MIFSNIFETHKCDFFYLSDRSNGVEEPKIYVLQMWAIYWGNGGDPDFEGPLRSPSSHMAVDGPKCMSEGVRSSLHRELGLPLPSPPSHTNFPTL